MTRAFLTQDKKTTSKAKIVLITALLLLFLCNRSIPVMAVTMDLTSLPAGLPNTFTASISCGIDFNGLGMSEPSESKLRRLYEVPDKATIRVNFRL